MAAEVATDFLAAARKAFRGNAKLPDIVDAVQAELTTLRGSGWVVVVGREIWRSLRYMKETHGVFKVSRSGKPDIYIMAYKCADDTAQAPDEHLAKAIEASKQHAANVNTALKDKRW